MSIYLSLKTQYENLGDEVINGLMLRELCRRTNVVALAEGVPRWYIGNLKQLLGDLADKIQFVSSSTTFIRKLLAAGLFGPESLMFTSCGDVSSTRSNYNRHLLFEALQYLPNLRLGMVGASYSNVSRSEARLLQVAHRRSSALSVRDRRSQQVLARSQVTVPVVPDLAFLMPTTAPASTGPNRDLALIMLREVAHVPFGQTLALTTNLAANLKLNRLRPAIAWQVGRDAAFGLRLADAAELPIVTPAEQTNGRFAKACELYDRTAVIFSNRLHGLLVAGSRGAIPVALLDIQERKIRGIFEDAGLTDMILPGDVGSIGAEDIEQVLRTDWQQLKAAFTRASHDLHVFFDRVAGPVR